MLMLTLILLDGEAKQYRAKSIMKWWTTCIPIVIAKAASRSVAAKTGKMSEAVFRA